MIAIAEPIQTKAQEVQAPRPGIYKNVPADVYHSWPCISSSFLKTVTLSSPAHAMAEKKSRETEDDKDHFIVGDSCHAALLEPERFSAEYAVGPDVKLNTREGKAAWATFEEANQGKVLIRGADGPKILGIHRSVWGNPEARRLLEQKTEIELSIVWMDPTTGVLCKCRPDVLCRGIREKVDLKTTTDAAIGDDGFVRKYLDFGYEMQTAFYRRGCRAWGIDILSDSIIAVEKSDPFASTVFGVDQELIDYGDFRVEQGLLIVSQCQQSGHWPAYSDRRERLRLPRYIIQKMLNQRSE